MSSNAIPSALGAETFEVTDPTDWLDTPLSVLMPVEQAFRCHVCKDFYNSPMITSCNHTFCSLCIRRSLSVEGKCPLCRATGQESKLRGNWALREAVDSFVKARPDMLAVARGSQLARMVQDRSPAPKRKREEPAKESPNPKRTRMSTRASKTRAAEATAAMMLEQVEVIDLEDGDDYRPEQEQEPEPDDGLVACPICQTRMKEWAVSKHLDTSCSGEPRPQPPASRGGTTSKPFPTFGVQRASKSEAPAERLPPLNYSLLNDINLRKKMSALGINTFGSRQMLEQRHKEWVTIFNANCDSARPKKRSELLQDLDVWERTLGTRAQTASRSANMSAQIKDKNFDGSAWATKHDTEFKDLIAAATATRKKAQQAAAAVAAPGAYLQRSSSLTEPPVTNSDSAINEETAAKPEAPAGPKATPVGAPDSSSALDATVGDSQEPPVRTTEIKEATQTSLSGEYGLMEEGKEGKIASLVEDAHPVNDGINNSAWRAII